MTNDTTEYTTATNTSTPEHSTVTLDSGYSAVPHAHELTAKSVSPSVTDESPTTADSVASGDSLPTPVRQIITHPVAPRPAPPAWQSGIEPMPRPQVAADNPGIISLFIILFLILSITFKHSRKLFGSLWSDLWNVRRRQRQYTKRTPAEARMVTTFYIQLIIFLALLTQCHFRLLWDQGSDISWSFPRTITYSLMWLAYYVFSLSTYRIVGYTFGQPITTSLWLRGFNAAQIFAGFGLAIPAAIAVFYPDSAGHAVIIGATIWFIARVIFIIKGFRIFYSGFSSFLDFFLYLCALEITPLFILYSVALYIAQAPL